MIEIFHISIIWSNFCSISLNNWIAFVFHHFLYGMYEVCSHNWDETHAELTVTSSSDLRPNWQEKRKKNSHESPVSIKFIPQLLVWKVKQGESLISWCMCRSFKCNKEIILTSFVISLYLNISRNFVCI